MVIPHHTIMILNLQEHGHKSQGHYGSNVFAFGVGKACVTC